MSSPIKTEHQGIVIEYDEQEEKWKFELRGRKRSSLSLKTAKEAIDKPAPSDEKPFTPISGWLWKSYSDPKPVTITSIAEPAPYSSGVEVWVRNEDGGRSKERASEILQDNDQVKALVKEHAALEKERSNLYEIGEKKKKEAMKFLIKLP